MYKKSPGKLLPRWAVGLAWLSACEDCAVVRISQQPFAGKHKKNLMVVPSSD
jgi:hypothetical protein